MSAGKAILLLGRRDEPTDGVADYCEKLREAGGAHELSVELARVSWAEKGWSEALGELRKAAAAWRGSLGFSPVHDAGVVFAAGFPCARPEFSMSCGKAAHVPPSFFMILCRRAVRESLAAPADIAQLARLAPALRSLRSGCLHGSRRQDHVASSAA